MGIIRDNVFKKPWILLAFEDKAYQQISQAPNIYNGLFEKF